MFADLKIDQVMDGDKMKTEAQVVYDNLASVRRLLNMPFDKVENPYRELKKVTISYVEVERIDDALRFLKNEPKFIIKKWHENPLGDYTRFHCPWCDRQLHESEMKEYVACPFCGNPIRY